MPFFEMDERVTSINIRRRSGSEQQQQQHSIEKWLQVLVVAAFFYLFRDDDLDVARPQQCAILINFVVSTTNCHSTSQCHHHRPCCYCWFHCLLFFADMCASFFRSVAQFFFRINCRQFTNRATICTLCLPI